MNKLNTMKQIIKSVLLLSVICLSVWQVAQAVRIETTTYYHYDALGSAVAASNQAGDVIWRRSYEAYGDEASNTNMDEDYEKHAYVGAQYDKETGLVYLQQRYYDPQIKRFISMDPVGFTPSNPASFNRYAYANNNPYRYIRSRWTGSKIELA